MTTVQKRTENEFVLTDLGSINILDLMSLKFASLALNKSECSNERLLNTYLFRQTNQITRVFMENIKEIQNLDLLLIWFPVITNLKVKPIKNMNIELFVIYKIF